MAKRMAADVYGVEKCLPPNREIDEHINLLLQLNENVESMEEYISILRNKALDIMLLLYSSQPRLAGKLLSNLVGRKCNIQIVAFSDNPYEIVKTLECTMYNIDTIKCGEGCLEIYVQCDDINGYIIIYIMSPQQKKHYNCNNVSWSIYTLARMVGRLDEAYARQEEESWLEYEANPDCFNVI